MMRPFLAAGVGVLIGLLLGYGLFREPRPDDGSGTPPGAAEATDAGASEAAGVAPPETHARSEVAARIAEALARETARRKELERELASLRAAAVDGAKADEARAVDGERTAASASGEPTEAVPGPREPSSGWIDEDVLLGAGFDAREVAELRERFEAIELERLFIRDQATREGWIDKPPYRRRMMQLDRSYTDLRDEYGDSAYDWVLYATGRNNRVVVERVLQDSPADLVGLEQGDVITHYDDEWIFAPGPLRRATTEGEAGESVALDVLRDGMPLRFYVERGPLGVGLEPKRIVPLHDR